MEDTVYWAHLAAIEGVGGALFDELLKRFGSLKRALDAPVDEVKEIPSMDATTAEAICRAKQTLPATQAKLEALAQQGVRVLTRLDKAYPARLRHALNPPPVIYLAGEWQAGDDHAVAIIGSRECSTVSAKRAHDYARQLAKQGLSVVSGYAPGVDLNSHLGALEARGRTIIIPGCGTDHFDFAPLKGQGVTNFLELAKRGIWLSEQPPDADWSTQGSLARNRLVAAVAHVVLVIEAALHSSTLDTVTCAQALGRPLFCQDYASLTQRVMGNEKLRREGATMIQGAEDLKQIVVLVKGATKTGKKARKDEDARR